jgi:hypothetical protein
MYDRMYDFDRFILRAGSSKAERVDAPRPNGFTFGLPPQFSNDGAFAIVEGTPAVIPSTWARYVDPHFSKSMRSQAAGMGDEAQRQVLQYFVVDLRQARSRPLWNAPIRPPVGTRLNVAWAPDGASALVGPTFLPLDATLPPDDLARALDGSSIAEVDIATGEFRVIPLDEALAARATELTWLSADSVRIQFGGESRVFRKSDGRWYVSTTLESAPRSAVDTGESKIRLEVRQNLNTPPLLYAIDTSTGDERMLLDPNPQLRSHFKLGRAEEIHWSDVGGRQWRGILYYPTNYARQQRFPVVIQTRGTLPRNEFSLYGRGGSAPALGPGSPGYVAQPLAGRDIAVLQVEDKYVEGVSLTPDEPQMHMIGYEAAVQHLISIGIADARKVGIMGYSRGGWRVQYTLTHSKFPFAAALTVDNMDAGYLQAAMLSWRPEFSEGLIGAPPFGEGLHVWLRNSPAFNAHNVQAPLQMQRTGRGLAGVLNMWEMFSRLRALGKPVELYVVPHINRGSHAIQNPAQCMASLQRALDWWVFWLKDEEDADPLKAEQYRQWRQLRNQLNQQNQPQTRQ